MKTKNLLLLLPLLVNSAIAEENIETEEIKTLANKWFGDIPSGNITNRTLPKEPKQTEERRLEVSRDVPANAIYKAYHMPNKTHADYYTIDLLSDVLSLGKSSRIYVSLVKNQKLFSEISAFISGSHDEGLFTISGKLLEGVSFKTAEEAILKEVELIKKELVNAAELSKVKNKIESTTQFSETSVLNKAMSLSFAELLGNANDVNSEVENYQKVTAEGINRVANEILIKTNCSTLIYAKSK